MAAGSGLVVAVDALTSWWFWVLVGLAVVVIGMIAMSHRRHLDQAARGWRSRASELYSRSVALHDRLAPALGSGGTLSPETIDRLRGAGWGIAGGSGGRCAVRGGAPDRPAPAGHQAPASRP